MSVVETANLAVISVPRDGVDVTVRDIFGRHDALERGPQAFLVDAIGPLTVDPHFHVIDQFQAFMEGDRVGKDPIQGAVTVLYTDSFTPYGPLVGTERLTFYNLRPRADLGAHYMPGARDSMVRKPGRRRIFSVDRAPISSATDVKTLPLIAAELDGLGAFETLAGPRCDLPVGVVGGSGRYELVLDGSLVVDDVAYAAGAVAFVSAGTTPPPRQSGRGGLHMISLQAPAD